MTSSMDFLNFAWFIRVNPSHFLNTYHLSNSARKGNFEELFSCCKQSMFSLSLLGVLGDTLIMISLYKRTEAQAS